MKRYLVCLLTSCLATCCLVAGFLLTGCHQQNHACDMDGDHDPAALEFRDQIETNSEAPKDIDELVFTKTDGSPIKLSDYQTKQSVVLVFTRGFSGSLCPFCKTQTSRLISNYEDFKKRNAEVLLVYPGPRGHLEEFIRAATVVEKQDVERVPFPILMDEDLAAVKHFGIADKLAKPATYVLDKNGKVRFAYVGSTPADRPSIKALLEQLERLSS